MRKLSESTTIIGLTHALEICHLCLQAEKMSGVRTTPLFLGPPGQGKSAIVEEFTRQLNEQRDEVFKQAIKEGRTEEEAAQLAGPHWVCQNYRLAQCDPTDLKGVPVYETIDGQEMCAFAPCKVFPMVGIPHSANGHNVVIFLDEVPQANPSIQNLAANIIDGKVGDGIIDMSRSFIICAGNRKEDHAATYEIPRNVGNRLIKCEIKTSFKEWETWAVGEKVHPLVIGFLQDKGSIFNEPPPSNGYVYGTPRSWHKLSCLIKSAGESFFDDKNRIAMPLAQGTVGSASANQFMQFVKTKMANFSLDDIMAGKSVALPTTAQKDITFSLVFEATYRINDWMAEAVSDPSYKALTTSADRAKKLVELLGKKKVDSIVNVYKWLDQPGIDPGFQVLINKYQSEISRNHLRYAMMTQKEFSAAKEKYEKINKVMIKS